MWRYAFCLPVLLLMLAGTGTVAAEPFDRGKALYEHHCQGCHEDWAHSREGRKATGREDLRKRTEAWAIHSDLPWTRGEVEDVVDYLDRSFYRF